MTTTKLFLLISILLPTLLQSQSHTFLIPQSYKDTSFTDIYQNHPGGKQIKPRMDDDRNTSYRHANVVIPDSIQQNLKEKFLERNDDPQRNNSGGGMTLGAHSGDIVIPSSPESQAMLASGSSNVDEYTGNLGYTIPITSIKDNGIQVPISLSYNSNSNKVDQIASSAGLGWSLNTGGVISRTIKNMPDEIISTFSTPLGITIDLYGYLHLKDQVVEGYALNNIENFYNLPQSTKAKVIEYSNWHNLSGFCNAPGDCPIGLDTEPDEFQFSFGGYSGAFVFDQQGTIHTIPEQNLKINPKIININGEPSIVEFTVTTPEGFTYVFGDDQLNSVETVRQRTITASNKYQYKVAGVSPSGFYYYFGYPFPHSTVSNLNNCTGITFDGYQLDRNRSGFQTTTYTNTWYLKSIKSPSKGEVLFNYKTLPEYSYTIGRNIELNLPNFEPIVLQGYFNEDTVWVDDPNSNFFFPFYASVEPPIPNQCNNFQFQTHWIYPHQSDLSFSNTDIIINAKKLEYISSTDQNEIRFYFDSERADLHGDYALDSIANYFNGTRVSSYIFPHLSKTNKKDMEVFPILIGCNKP